MGLKYIYFDIGGATNVGGLLPLEGERSVAWADPILAMRVKYLPHPRIEVSVYGDTDGDLIGKEFNYQFIGIASFAIKKWLLVSTGYRLWGVDMDGDEAIYSGQIRGAVVRIGFQF